MALEGFLVRLCINQIGIVDFISQRHYSRTCPRNTRYAFELIAPDGCRVGLCLYGPFSRLQAQKKYIGCLELTRLWVDDAVPKNGESFLIGRSLRWLKRQNDVVGVVSYADPNVGHSGVIYRAANFIEDGMTSRSYHYVDTNGDRVHIRSVWGRYKKNQESNPDWTEAKQAESEGLVRRDDKPKIRFIYRWSDQLPVQKNTQIKLLKKSKPIISGELSVEDRLRLILERSDIKLLGQYVSTKLLIKLVCKCGEHFERLPKIVLRTKDTEVVQCRNCRYKKQANKQIIVRDYAFVVHSFGGEIVGDHPIKTSDFVCVRCVKHNITFSARASNLLDGHWNCPKCSNRYLMSTDEIREMVSRIGGTLLSTTVLNVTDKISVLCGEGHEFWISINKIKNGRWCKICSGQRYVGEEISRQFMEFVFDKKFPKSRPIWLALGDNRFELDGYNDEIKIAFEHDGDQHFREIGKYHGKGKISLSEMQIRDHLKSNICEKNGVHLIRFKEHKNGLLIAQQFLECGGHRSAIKDPMDFVPDIQAAYAGKSERQISKLKVLLDKKGWKFVSGLYEGVNSKMLITCPVGHLVERHFTSIIHKDIWLCRECKAATTNS